MCLYENVALFSSLLAKWILSGEQSERKSGEEVLSQSYHLQRMSESMHSSSRAADDLRSLFNLKWQRICTEV